jgi:hypothetical protein
MIMIETHNLTTAYPEPHDQREIEVLEQWIETGSVPTDYLQAVCGGTFSTTDEPFSSVTNGLAERMVADPSFVAGAEEGWRAISQGRCSNLEDVKRRLGDI